MRYGIKMEVITEQELKKLSALAKLNLMQYQREGLWNHVTFNAVRAILMYQLNVEQSADAVRKIVKHKEYKDVIDNLIKVVEDLPEHEHLTKVKNMYLPIINEYYDLRDAKTEMPDEVYQVIMKSIELLMVDLDAHTQKQVDKLTKLLDEIKKAEQ